MESKMSLDKDMKMGIIKRYKAWRKAKSTSELKTDIRKALKILRESNNDGLKQTTISKMKDVVRTQRHQSLGRDNLIITMCDGYTIEISRYGIDILRKGGIMVACRLREVYK